MAFLDRFKKKINSQLEPKTPAVAASVKKGNAIKTEPANQSEAKDVAVKTAPSAAVKSAGLGYRVIVRPLVTEKAATAESANKYSFIVSAGASAGAVGRAVAELYGVKPLKINTINVQGRRLRSGRGGRRSDFKKAIVTLAKGASITIHEGV